MENIPFSITKLDTDENSYSLFHFLSNILKTKHHDIFSYF